MVVAYSTLGFVSYARETGTGAIAMAVKPGGAFRLLGVQIHFDSAQTQDTLTITIDGGTTADVYDTLLYSRATGTGSVTDLNIPFGKGYEYEATDEIDIVYTGTDNDVYGVIVTYELLGT